MSLSSWLPAKHDPITFQYSAKRNWWLVCSLPRRPWGAANLTFINFKKTKNHILFVQGLDSLQTWFLSQGNLHCQGQLAIDCSEILTAAETSRSVFHWVNVQGLLQSRIFKRTEPEICSRRIKKPKNNKLNHLTIGAEGFRKRWSIVCQVQLRFKTAAIILLRDTGWTLKRLLCAMVLDRNETMDLSERLQCLPFLSPWNALVTPLNSLKCWEEWIWIPYRQ